MNTKRYFEDRVKSAFGFHYASKLQNLYAHNNRRTPLFSSLDFTDKAVLDVGCGDGTWLVEFMKMGASRVNGIEQSDLLAKNARKHIQDNRTYNCVDVGIMSMPIESEEWNQTYVYKGVFDIATLITVFNFIDPQKRLQGLKNIHQMLKPFGKIAIIEYAPNKVPEFQKHLDYKTVWTEEQVLQSIDAAGFTTLNVIPVNVVDSLLFHYFGVNYLTYTLTMFADKFLPRWFPQMAKYKLFIAIRRDI